MNYDKKNNISKYTKILNNTFVDYNRKENKSFSPLEHKFLHDLIYSRKDINITMAEKLSDRALDVAKKIRENQIERGKKMLQFAESLGYKDIKIDRFGTAWIKDNDENYIRVNADLLRE